MTLQVERHQVRDDMVGVPGVAGLDRLVAAVRQLLAQQPIVLDIVGLSERIPAEEMMGDDDRCDLPAEQGDQPGSDYERERKALQDLVIDRPNGLAALGQPFRLIAPATLERTG